MAKDAEDNVGSQTVETKARPAKVAARIVDLSDARGKQDHNSSPFFGGFAPAPSH